MRSDFGKKIVLLIHWLMSLALGIAMIVLFFMDVLPVKAQGAAAIVFAIAALIVYLIFAAGALLINFPAFWRWKERNFVTISAGGLGRTRIAVPALDQMIRKAMRDIEGVADLKTQIVNGDDSVEINVNIMLAAGAHVPTVTSNAQRAVRSYIEKHCGIEVSAVIVSVFSVQDDGEADARKGIKWPKKSQSTVKAEPIKEEAANPAPTDGDAWDGLTMDDAEDTPKAEEAFEAETSDEASDETPAGDEATEAPVQGLSRSAKKRRRRKKKQAKLNAQSEAEPDVAAENGDEAEDTSVEDAFDAIEPVEGVEDAFDAVDEPAEEAADASPEEEEPVQDAEDTFTEYEEPAEPDYTSEDTYEAEYPVDGDETRKYDDYLND